MSASPPLASARHHRGLATGDSPSGKQHIARPALDMACRIAQATNCAAKRTALVAAGRLAVLVWRAVDLWVVRSTMAISGGLAV
jgi:hypothetical protein